MLNEIAGNVTDQSGGDLHQAAEADIMRFIGILALCLMVLFSVDQTFRPRQAASETAAVARPPNAARSAASQLAAPPAVESARQEPRAADVSAPREETTPPIPAESAAVHAMAGVGEVPMSSAQQGAALYFESDLAFLTLLTQRRIEAFLKVGDSWSAVGVTGANPVPPPAAPLYRLLSGTVPELLRRHVGAAPTLTAEWLVRLDPQIERQLRTQERSSGAAALVIERSGQVRIALPDEEVRRD